MKIRRIFSRASLRKLGPGLITGAADDDPSGIATYAQAGAAFGSGLCWVMVFTLPLMAAVQLISARIGCVTGQGLGASLRGFAPRWVGLGFVALLALANIINLGADIGAMADAVHVFLGGPPYFLAMIIAVGCAAAEIWLAYPAYVRVLKWLTASLLCYPLLLCAVRTPWRDVLHDTFIPRHIFDHDGLMMLVAVLGTTISPYLFFWQAATEAENSLKMPDPARLRVRSREGRRELRRINADTWVGMGYSNLVAWTIMVGTAVTLHAHGVHDVQTSTDAAKALQPIAGRWAGLLFGFGILGTGLLAIPTLAGSVAYALGETMGWPVGLNREPAEAKYFYAVIGLSTLVGALIVFSPISPMQALVWSAVINGFIAVPMIVGVIIIGSSPKIMGEMVIPLWQKILGWIAAVAMSGCAIGSLLP